MTREIETIGDEFLKVIFAEDELGTVVRAHIIIEAQVNEMLDFFLPFPDELPRLRFEQKIRLLIALGLSKEYLKPLIELGNIRNAFGHRIDTILTAGMVAGWHKTFSNSDQEMMQRAFNRTAKDCSFSSDEMTDADPKGMFRLLAVFLRQTLLAAQAELREEHAT